MLRFIDLTGQITSSFEFAWYDTVKDTFITFNGIQTWDCWKDFEEDLKLDTDLCIGRFKALFPKDKLRE